MLTIDNLSCVREQRFLFKNISHTVLPHSVLQVQGHNGSGKSTLLRLIAGLLAYEKGRVLWDNKEITEQRETYQAALSYVGHDHGLKLHLTVTENLKLATLLSANDATQINYSIQQLGLTNIHNQLTKNLSAGQQRRTALARLLLSPARLWILDEPTTALDKQGLETLRSLIQTHIASGGALIVATHHTLDLPNTTFLTLGEKHA
jgi:heme exporter protein A